jgi:hypothetical protein
VISIRRAGLGAGLGAKSHRLWTMN